MLDTSLLFSGLLIASSIHLSRLSHVVLNIDENYNYCPFNLGALKIDKCQRILRCYSHDLCKRMENFICLPLARSPGVKITDGLTIKTLLNSRITLVHPTLLNSIPLSSHRVTPLFTDRQLAPIISLPIGQWWGNTDLWLDVDRTPQSVLWPAFGVKMFKLLWPFNL